MMYTKYCLLFTLTFPIHHVILSEAKDLLSIGVGKQILRIAQDDKYSKRRGKNTNEIFFGTRPRIGLMANVRQRDGHQTI